MVAFTRILGAGAALTCSFVAGPAAALTLTFQMSVTGSSEGAPPIDDFQMTWTFEPALYDNGGFKTYYGDVAGVIDAPQNADMFAVAGLVPPFEQGSVQRTSWALFRTNEGSSTTAVEFLQAFRQGDEATQRFSVYEIEMGGSAFTPAVAYTPGGFVHILQTMGNLQWHQRATQDVGGFFPDGPPRERVAERFYAGTAHLIAWDVPPENPAVPEPGTWALMILGFGLSGAALRRQRNVRVPAGVATFAPEGW